MEKDQDLIKNPEVVEEINEKEKDEKTFKRLRKVLYFLLAGLFFISGYLGADHINKNSKSKSGESSNQDVTVEIPNEEENVKENFVVETPVYDVNVFDDINDEEKVYNRAEKILAGLEASGIEHNWKIEDIEWLLKVFNAGIIDKVDETEVRFAYDILAELIMKNIFNPANEYVKNNWQGNYKAFDFSMFLLDGSDGQKLAETVYENFNNIYTSDESKVEENSTPLMEHIVETEDLKGFLGGPSVSRLRLKLHTAFNITYNRVALTFLGTKSPNTTYTYPADLPKEICEGGTITAGELLEDLNSIYPSEFDTALNEGVQELKRAKSDCFTLSRGR